MKNKIESPQKPNLQNLYIVLLCVNENNFFAQSRFSSNSKILCDNSKILFSQIFPFSCVNQIVEIQILFQNSEKKCFEISIHWRLYEIKGGFQQKLKLLLLKQDHVSINHEEK